MEDKAYERRYEDNVAGKGRKFFIYAPPLRGVRPSKRRPPNPPYRNAEPYKCSVYFYWWAYLRRSKLYKRTCEANGKGKLANLYADFGNVWDDKGSEIDTFWYWWTNHSHLFCEPSARRLQEVAVSDTETSDSDIVIKVPLEMRSVFLVKQFRELLAVNKHRIEKARRTSRANYPVRNNVRLSSLHQHLAVYDAINENSHLKLHEVAELDHIKANVYVTDAVYYSGHQLVYFNSMNEDDKRYKSVSNTMRRRKRQAMYRHKIACEEYIANVERGLFPLR